MSLISCDSAMLNSIFSDFAKFLTCNCIINLLQRAPHAAQLTVTLRAPHADACRVYQQQQAPQKQQARPNHVHHLHYFKRFFHGLSPSTHQVYQQETL